MVRSAARAPRDPRPDTASVGAAFVTFHPDPGFPIRVASVAPQVGGVIVIDNGSTEAELAPIRKMAETGALELLLNGSNLGLGFALNQALKWGEEKGFAWVATFDQDTQPGLTLVEEAGRVFDARPNGPAIIGAGWVSNPEYRAECDDPAGIEVACVITSGAIHSVAAWRALGGFRSDFFIDYVDTEFCLRARAAGYPVVRTCRLTMTHAIGQPTRQRLIFRSVTPSNHSAMRRYYITRNRIRVWRMYGRREASYIRYDMQMFFKELIKIAFVEEDRSAKLWAVARGVWAGLIRRPETAGRRETTGAAGIRRPRERVLLVMHELSRTGAPRLALEIFAELRETLDLWVAAREGGPLLGDFGRIVRMSVIDRRRHRPWGNPGAWLRSTILRARMTRWRPTLIYVNSALALPLAMRLRPAGVPVLLHLHEAAVALADFELAHPGLLRSVPDLYVTVSRTVAEALSAGFGVPLERIRTVPPFIDPPAIRVAPSNHIPVVGGMGHPSWTKGLTLWLLAARDIVDRQPAIAVRFRWVGIREDLEGNHLKAMVRKLGLEDVVELVPETSAPFEEMRRFDVLAVASWEEAASLVTLEAMAMGVPVVCFTGAGGPAEELEGTGVALPDFSPSSLADAIINLLDDPERRSKVGVAERERAAGQYGRARTVAAIYAAITDVAGRPSRAVGLSDGSVGPTEGGVAVR